MSRVSGGPNTYSRVLRGFEGPVPFLIGHTLRHAALRFANLFDGQNLFHNQSLRNDRLEFVIQQINRINFFGAYRSITRSASSDARA